MTAVEPATVILVPQELASSTAQRFIQDQFRRAVEAWPGGVVMTDHDGTIVIVNDEIERLFGYAREELIGQAVELLMPERFRNPHMEHRWEFAMRPEIRRLGTGRDLFGRRKDGTEFPAEIALNPIHIGSELLVLSVIVDITERKRAERLKDEFVSTVSHELRTPMTSISGSLGLLVGGAAGALPEPATRLLGIANANCQRLVRLINDILDIQKFEAGQIVFDLQRIEVRSLVEQTIETMRGFADGHRVQIRFDESSMTAEVNADADRLAQVVTNLVSNAIKFSPLEQEVVIGVVWRGGNVVISVRDHGDGIPDGFKPHIFEKFAQAPGTHPNGGGTGLGLNIVKKIVDRLGGRVSFDDAAGGGTIFSVELPAWEEANGVQLVPGIVGNGSAAAPSRRHGDEV